jgi:hypothetical protein
VWRELGDGESSERHLHGRAIIEPQVENRFVLEWFEDEFLVQPDPDNFLLLGPLENFRPRSSSLSHFTCGKQVPRSS